MSELERIVRGFDVSDWFTIGVLAALIIIGTLIERRTLHRALRGRVRRSGVWVHGRRGAVAAGAPRGWRGSWFVYLQFRLTGEIDYIGKTDNPRRRFAEHAQHHDGRAARWYQWQTYRCATEAEALELERHLIRQAAAQGHPLSNHTHNPNRGHTS